MQPMASAAPRPTYYPDAISALDRSFAILTKGPRPLAIEGWLFPGCLPAREIPLCELREILLVDRLPLRDSDFVLSEMVRRARRDPKWMVGLAGVMSPGIKSAMARAGKLNVYVRPEVASEVLSAFIDTVATLDLSRPYIACRLLGPVKNRVRDSSLKEMTAFGRIGGPSYPKAPPPPVNHPEIVLAKAVRAGVITKAEAELIAATRLEGDRMVEAAARRHCSFEAVHKRRKRAEKRLVAWLAESGWKPTAGKRRCVNRHNFAGTCPSRQLS